MELDLAGTQSTSSRSPGAMTGIIVPATGASLLVLVFDGPHQGFAVWLGILNSTLCLWQLCIGWQKLSGGPVLTMFWVFTLVWLGIGPLVQIQAGVMPWPDESMTQYYVPAQLLILASLSAVALGAAWARRGGSLSASNVQRSLRPKHPDRRGLADRKAWILSIAVILTPVVIVKSGGLSARFSTRDDLQAALAESLGTNNIGAFLVNRLPAAAAVVSLYVWLFALRTQWRGPTRSGGAYVERFGYVVAGVTMSAVCVAILANPFSSSRYASLGAVLAVFLALVELRTRRSLVVFTSLLTIGMLFIYPLASLFKKPSQATAPLNIGSGAFKSIDFDGFQQTVNSLYYVQLHGISWGSHVLAAFGFFIPRGIWTWKPKPASLDIAAARGYPFQNLSLPFQTELFVDLGVVGMVVSLVGLSYAMQRIDSGYLDTANSFSGHCAAMVAVGLSGLLRGPLGGSVVTFAPIVAFAILVYYKKKRPEPHLEHTAAWSRCRNYGTRGRAK